MGSKRTPEQRIRIKIGLILIVIILYFTGLFIYTYIFKQHIDKQKQEMINANNVLTYSNQLIVSVQQAQDMLNNYLVSPQRIFQQQYDSIRTDISGQIAQIKRVSKENEKDILLEDIDSLLREKNRIVNKLVRQFRSQNPLIELDRKIENYDTIIQDSIVVTTSKDTTMVSKQRKDFWSRLKNLIDPKYAPDTTLTISRTEQEARSTSRVDTVMYADLKNITQEASKTYSTQIEGIERQVRELILAEQNISLGISRLITRYYNEAIETSKEGTENSESLTQRIFSFALTVGAVSLLLILVIIFLIIDDLNKGQKARIDLAKEKQHTEELIESRHKLLLSVSHDIKTPLSSIMGYMEMWDTDDVPEERQRQLTSARNSGRHILSMLGNLLEFSRLERNKGEMHYSRFELMELINDVINMFRPFTEEKELHLELENMTSSPFFVETDYTLLKQILVNVTSNAVKYTLQGSVRIRLEYAQQLIFTITDTGIGIDREDLEKIFRPFSRIKNPLKAEGNGFGLYVTRGLVDSLKGEITITSEKGKGTSVTIRLPLSRLDPQQYAANELQPMMNSSLIEKVLLFEDDASLGNMLKEFLLQKGYKVKLCSNTRDVKGFLRLISSFDIVFTDMQMMQITGIDILREIRKSDMAIPVWLMTAYDEYTSEKAVEEGFTGLITKPIRMSRLTEILSISAHQEEREEVFNGRFPKLTTLFHNDVQVIKDILATFVETSEKDREALTELINRNDFKNAQALCHRIYPFFSQLDADHLCGPLRKMDRLRGSEEDSYPAWAEELRESIEQIGEFAEQIRKEYL
ncbi:MAG: response regulator [Proteiniphilum sp.]|jgi:signal transduction histidine kinase/DNA-binding response OmpR family regulator/CHASE3 domain sensor protein|nr:response regulator [Proteiniphilum sp.]